LKGAVIWPKTIVFSQFGMVKLVGWWLKVLKCQHFTYNGIGFRQMEQTIAVISRD